MARPTIPKDINNTLLKRRNTFVYNVSRLLCIFGTFAILGRGVACSSPFFSDVRTSRIVVCRRLDHSARHSPCFVARSVAKTILNRFCLASRLEPLCRWQSRFASSSGSSKTKTHPIGCVLCWRCRPGIPSADTRTLRLKSELFDLRVGYVNRLSLRFAQRNRFKSKAYTAKRKK